MPCDEYAHQTGVTPNAGAVASVLDRRIDAGAGSVTRGSPSLAARTGVVGSASGRPADRHQAAAPHAGSSGAAECYSPERYEGRIRVGFAHLFVLWQSKPLKTTKLCLPNLFRCDQSDPQKAASACHDSAIDGC